MNIPISLFLSTALCILPNLIRAHVHVEEVVSSEVLNVADIQPFAKPFTQVPKLVFANPPYVELILTDENCSKIRTAADASTKQKILNLVKRVEPDLDEEAIEARCVEKARNYDWIHAMNLVHAHQVIKSEIDIPFVRALNSRLTRLTADKPGAFRAHHKARDRSKLDEEETIFNLYINRDKKSLCFFKNLGNNHIREFCESVDALLNDNDRYLRVVERRYVSTESIKDLFIQLNRPENILMNEDTVSLHKLNLSTVDEWERQDQSGNQDKHRPGFIDLIYWITTRKLEICLPQNICAHLYLVLQLHARSSLHPIEKAAHLWLDVIRQQPFLDANKRTAKALANIVLLEHGYLPPVLLKNDIELYKEVLKKSFDPEKGYELFTQFVARMVKRTQDDYAGKII